MVGVEPHEPGSQLGARERPATDLRFSLDDLRLLAHAFLQRLSTSTYFRDVFGQHPEHRYLRASPLRISVECEGRLERGQRELVGAYGAREWIVATSGDRVSRAQQNPGLRATEQLVAREGDGVDAAREGFGHRGLAGEAPG